MDRGACRDTVQWGRKESDTDLATKARKTQPSESDVGLDLGFAAF